MSRDTKNHCYDKTIIDVRIDNPYDCFIAGLR